MALASIFLSVRAERQDPHTAGLTEDYTAGVNNSRPMANAVRAFARGAGSDLGAGRFLVSAKDRSSDITAVRSRHRPRAAAVRTASTAGGIIRC
jgi:hypothetical protein